MSRSIWKGPFQAKKLYKFKFKYKKRFDIWSRSSVISARFIKKLVFINTGNNYKKVYITRNHIGYKFGEFTTTRAFQTRAEKKKLFKKG